MFEFMRFAGVGVLGFIVDISSFYILSTLIDVFDARVIAFIIAVMTTWFGNRLVTFKSKNNDNKLNQFFKYMIVALSAGAINLFIFNSLILWEIKTKLAFVSGGLCGMLVNYFGVKFGIFKPAY